MPRFEEILTVFVASPSDVTEERAKLEEIVAELNVAWSKSQGIRLELVKWETHSYPALGSDPQAVINDQIGDYDIFIGILWHRVGTPTPRATSGTLEEFERAYARHSQDPTTVKVMFYFKDEPVSPSSLDTDQLRQVIEFKDVLGPLGGLYFQFKDIRDFESLIRLHLSRQIQNWRITENQRNHLPLEEARTEETDEVQTDSPEPDDAGFIDLILKSQEEFSELQNIMNRITDNISLLNRSLEAHTSKLTGMMLNGNITADPKTVLDLFGSLASDMEVFSKTVGRELPLYKRSFRSGIEATVEASAMSLRLASPEQVRQRESELATELEKLETGIIQAREMMVGFRASVAATPPLSAKLNKAKRHLLSALDSLTEEWEQNLDLIRGARP